MKILLILVGLVLISNVEECGSEPYVGLHVISTDIYKIASSLASTVSANIGSWYSLTPSLVRTSNSPVIASLIGALQDFYYLHLKYLNGWPGPIGKTYFTIIDILKHSSCVFSNYVPFVENFFRFMLGVPGVLQRLSDGGINQTMVTQMSDNYALMNTTFQLIVANIYDSSLIAAQIYDDNTKPLPPVLKIPTSLQPYVTNLVTLTANLRTISCNARTYLTNVASAILTSQLNFQLVDNLVVVRTPYRNFSINLYIKQTWAVNRLYLSYIRYTNNVCQNFGNYYNRLLGLLYRDDIVKPEWQNQQLGPYNATLKEVTQNLQSVYLYMYDVMYIFTVEIYVYYNAIFVEMLDAIYTLLKHIIDVTYQRLISVTCSNTAASSLFTHIIQYFTKLDYTLYTRLWRLWTPYRNYISWVFKYQSNWTQTYYKYNYQANVKGGIICFSEGNTNSPSDKRTKTKNCVWNFVYDASNVSASILTMGMPMAYGFQNEYVVLANDIEAAQLTVRDESFANLLKIKVIYDGCVVQSKPRTTYC